MRLMPPSHPKEERLVSAQRLLFPKEERLVYAQRLLLFLRKKGFPMRRGLPLP